MEPVSMDKKYVTVGNRYPVRIYAVDGDVPSCVHGAILMGDAWRFASWGENGRYWGELQPDSLDLVEVKEPEREELWLNMYPKIYPPGAPNQSRSVVEMARRTDWLATVGIELLIHDDGRKEARIIEVV